MGFVEFWVSLWNNIVSFFTYTGDDGASMPMYQRLIIALVIIVGGFLLIKFIFMFLNKALHVKDKKKSTAKTATRFALSCIKTLAYFVIFVSALKVLGFNLSGLSTIISSGILAIGVSLQDIISNFASGIIILSTKLYIEGDYVEINDSIAGSVKEIKMMTTVLTTPNNIDITIPNSTATKGKVTNYNVNEFRRVDLVASVAYGTDIEETKKVIKYIVLQDKRVDQNQPITVAVKAMSASSIDFAVRCYVAKGDYWDVTFDLNEKILIEFAKRNIEIPFSQLDVNLYNGGNKKLGKIKTSDITEDMITPHKSEAIEENPVYEIDKVLKEAKKKITSKKKTTAKNKSEKK